MTEAAERGEAEGPVQLDGAEHLAHAWSTPEGSVLVTAGSPAVDPRPLLDMLPLLGALFRSELESALARQRAEQAQDAARIAQALAEGIDAARAELQATTRELRAAKEAADTASRAKTLFLANMSHELRTPLHGIMGMVDLLSAGGLSEQQVADLEVIRSTCRGLLSVIDDLLEFSRIEARQVQLEEAPFDLDALLRTVAAVHRKTAADRGLRLVYRPDVEPPGIVIGDQHRLAQVLHNLLSNAVKFTESGAVELHLVDSRVAEGATWVALEVRDTGIGISGEQMPSLFEPFRQADSSFARRYGGSGLGLAIVRDLVGLMGGQLSVESTPGSGSTFRVEIPVRSAGAAAAEKPAGTPPDPAPRLRVLVAEDNAVNRQVMRRLLERAGHDVVLAVDGREALEVWQDHPLDLVLMDLQMPGLDGLQALRMIREREALTGRARTPVAAVTAHASRDDRERCLAAGADHYVPKPFPPGVLEHLLAEVARGRGAEPLEAEEA